MEGHWKGNLIPVAHILSGAFANDVSISASSLKDLLLSQCFIEMPYFSDFQSLCTEFDVPFFELLYSGLFLENRKYSEQETLWCENINLSLDESDFNGIAWCEVDGKGKPRTTIGHVGSANKTDIKVHRLKQRSAEIRAQLKKHGFKKLYGTAIYSKADKVLSIAVFLEALIGQRIYQAVSNDARSSKNPLSKRLAERGRVREVIIDILNWRFQLDLRALGVRSTENYITKDMFKQRMLRGDDEALVLRNPKKFKDWLGRLSNMLRRLDR